MADTKLSKCTFYLYVGLAVAIIIRLLVIPNPGFEADIAFWKSWGLAVLDFGIIKGLPLTNFNYPTPFGYFLALIPATYRLFADPHNFGEFWQNTNLTFLIVSKLPAIVADFGIAGIIIWIGRNPKRFEFPDFGCHSRAGGNRFWFFNAKSDPRLREDDSGGGNCIYILFAIIYLLNPVSWMDSAWWGQVDSLGVFTFLLAFLAVLRRKPFLAGVVYMVAMMTKLQNMIYGPLFFLFIWQFSGPAGLARAAAGALTGFVGLNIEFILSGKTARVLESLTGNYDYFPWLSLNAFNLWWIVSGARGMQFSDKLLSVGLANAKTVGLYLFSAGYLMAALMMKPFAWIAKKSDNASAVIYRFLTALVIGNAAFFLFQTESHDRYAFPLIVFILLWGVFWICNHIPVKESLQVFTSKPFRIFSILYFLFSILYFYNLHTALVFNYPHNGLPLLSAFIQPPLTIGVSLIFIGAFFLFLWAIRRDISGWTYALPVALLIIALLAKNVPLVTRKPIFLTAITPTSNSQDYGLRQINMPVNATLGFDKWSPLSAQYAFYRHGIGTHANSQQTFDLSRYFHRFTFDYGVDTEAGPKGTVVFEVYGDGRLLFASQKIGRFEIPRHADINISGVKTLKLVVTDAGDGITDDHADWLNPLLWE